MQIRGIALACFLIFSSVSHAAPKKNACKEWLFFYGLPISSLFVTIPLLVFVDYSMVNQYRAEAEQVLNSMPAEEFSDSALQNTSVAHTRAHGMTYFIKDGILFRVRDGKPEVASGAHNDLVKIETRFEEGKEQVYVRTESGSEIHFSEGMFGGRFWGSPSGRSGGSDSTSTTVVNQIINAQ